VGVEPSPSKRALVFQTSERTTSSRIFHWRRAEYSKPTRYRATRLAGGAEDLLSLLSIYFGGRVRYRSPYLSVPLVFKTRSSASLITLPYMLRKERDSNPRILFQIYGFQDRSTQPTLPFPIL